MPQDSQDPPPNRPVPLRLIKGGLDDGQLRHNIASASIAQIVLAVAAVLGVCYAAKVPLITLFTSMLIAFILAPLVDRFEAMRIPRWAGSAIAVTLLFVVLYSVAYFSYNRAMEFMDELPKYSAKIRDTTIRFRKQAEKLQQTTQTVLPETAEERQAVKVREQTSLSDWITDATVTEVIVGVSFVPFLVYFMLSWSRRSREATVQLFRPENRRRVEVTLRGIADMLRGFLIGNFICGLFMAAVSATVFGYLGLQYFYFLGVISGFLSLIPYLGVVLALMPPLAAGIGQLTSTEMVAIFGLVVGLHVFAINVLFPKVIGKRLSLNPLVVTIALLGWGWIWGAMGLILAIPITGALKIICDHVDSLRPLGAWMEN